MRSTSFILVIILFVCCNSKPSIKITHSEKKDETLKQLRDVTWNYIDTVLVDQNANVFVKFETVLDTDMSDILNNWVKYNKQEIDDEEKNLFSQLTIANYDSAYVAKHDTTFIKGQGILSKVQIKFSGLSFNRDTTKIATVLSVLFGDTSKSEFISGWQDIVVYKKENTGWKIKKRSPIIEY